MTVFKLFSDLSAKHGQAVLARKIGCDPAQLSRFLSGKNGLPLPVIEKAVELAEAVITPRNYLRDLISKYEAQIARLEDALETVIDRMKELKRKLTQARMGLSDDEGKVQARYGP